METFAADILAELRTREAAWVPVLKLTFPGEGGSVYLAGRDWACLGGNAVTGRVIEWQNFGRRVEYKNSNLIQSAFAVEIANQKTGNDWQSFLDRISGVSIQRTLAELRYYPLRLINNPAKYITVFRGYLEHLENYDEQSCRFEICDGLKHINVQIGDLLSNELYEATIADSAKGLMLPLIWGRIDPCPTICIKHAKTAKLAEDIDEIATRIYYSSEEETADEWPNEGSIFVGDELIFYHGRTDTYFDECTRGGDHTEARPHYKGTNIIRWRAEGDDPIYHDFLVAGHACSALSDVRVNEKPIPFNDYDTFPSLNHAGGWDQKLALIRFNRNPIYPDEEGATRIKTVRFEGLSPGTAGVANATFVYDSDQATFALMSSGGKLRLNCGGQHWSYAKKSLGYVRKATLRVRSRVVLDNDDDPELDPTQGTFRTRVYCAGSYGNYTNLSKPAMTGSAATGYARPTSVHVWKDTDGYVSSWEGWFSQDMILVDNDSYWAWVRHAASGAVPNGAYIEISLEDIRRKVYKVTAARACCRYKFYVNPGESTEKLGVYRLSGKIYSAVIEGWNLSQASPNSTITQKFGILSSYPKALRDHFKALQVQIFNGGVFSAQHNLDIYHLWMEYDYTPTDYPITRDDEIDITDKVADWSDLDEVIVDIEFSGSDKKVRIYDAHIEIEYWPYIPSSKYDITCRVSGRTGYYSLRGYNEYAEDILRDLLINRILQRSPSDYAGGLNFFSVDTPSFEAGDRASRRCYDLRIADQAGALELLGRLAYEMRCWLMFRNLIFYAYWRIGGGSFGSSVWDIMTSDIVRRSVRLLPQRVEEIINYVEVNSCYDHSKRSWRNNNYAKSQNSISKYGIRKFPQPVNIESMSDLSDYQGDVANFYVELLREPRMLYEFMVMSEGLKLQLADPITLAYAPLSISNQKLKVVGLEFVPPNPQQGNTPGVKITAIAEQVPS